MGQLRQHRENRGLVSSGVLPSVPPLWVLLRWIEMCFGTTCYTFFSCGFL